MDDFEIRSLGVEDAVQFAQLACIAFHSKNARLGDNEVYRQHAIQTEETAQMDKTHLGNVRIRTGLFREGKLLSTLAANAFEVNFDGHICEMCGIGGVMSDPSARKTGGVSRILRQEFAAMRERGQIFSHLYPFQTSFYRKFGYEHCAFAVKWTIPTQFLPSIPAGGIQWFENTPEQQQAVKAVYHDFDAGYNLAVARSDIRWSALFDKLQPYVNTVFSYLHTGENGPDGFLSYHTETHDDALMTVHVDHLYFSNPEALRQLLAFLGSLRAYVGLVKLQLPTDADISFWLTELCSGYDKCNVRREIIHQGSSRVVDAEKALKLAGYLGAGAANIRILDPDCPWNHKTFHVEFDGSCRHIREAEDWDIQLDIGAFTALILGSRDFSQAAYMDGVEIRKNEENLRKVFYKKPVWIGDSF